MVLVRAPLAGRVDALDTVPDPVFASGMLGAGMVITPLPPDGEAPDPLATPVPAGESESPPPAVAPVGGILAAVQPHAYAIQPEDGPAILVHLGIDTVTLLGTGFQALAERGSTLAVGDGVISWDPRAVREAGLAPLVPLIAMQSTDIRYLIEPGAYVQIGDPLFEAD